MEIDNIHVYYPIDIARITSRNFPDQQGPGIRFFLFFMRSLSVRNFNHPELEVKSSVQPNPILKKLGFTQQDRLAIIHADDLGMCHASLVAGAELFEYGLVSSGAVMVPCPWFPAVADYARSHPKADLGIHLTLNSEWQNYRWGPLSSRDPQSGLLDEQGYFHRQAHQTQELADPQAVQIEMAAQMERALAAGIRPTHADTHMGTVAHPKFMLGYIQLALQYGVPAMMLRLDEEWLAGHKPQPRWGSLG